MCTNEELQIQIKDLQDVTAKQCDDITALHASQQRIETTLNDWTPYIKKGMKKAQAYEFIGNDWKGKATTFAIYAGAISVLVAIIAGLMTILEKINK